MKKVLIISYYWPPAGGPAAQRVVKFSKYFPELGWQPVILTVKDGEFPYVDPFLEEDLSHDVIVSRAKSWEPFSVYKKVTRRSEEDALPVGLLTHEKKGFVECISRWIRANMFIPDARIGWTPSAVRRGMQLVRRHKIDLILTSSPPHSSQLIGHALQGKTGIPWVADLRDPWTTIRYYDFTKRSLVARKVDAWLEKRVLTRADRIITVSEALASEFKAKLNTRIRDKVQVVMNGYDEFDFRRQKKERGKKFIILHAGNCQAHQNPDVLWRSLAMLKKTGGINSDMIAVQFTGKIDPKIMESAKAYGVFDFIRLREFIPHREIVKEMMNASVMLMIVPRVKWNKGIVTGKLFEYVGSANPVLVIGPPDGNAGKIISDFPESTICDYQDIEGVTAFITKTFSDWQSGKSVKTRPKTRQKYTRFCQARQLVDLFNTLI
ncbi:MAG: glycosyltransferase [candidate division KSB1 bacterium]|jgi:glycosyltransferase involved in cell wall biosynthesis|nr:glycosyltransferase [candidate division KSB1 bacterium]